MSTLSRRAFLGVAAGAVAAPFAPALPSAADVTILGPDMAVEPSKHIMWAIGTPDSYDWQPISAATREAAFREYLSSHGITEADKIVPSIDECVQRVAIWDDLGPEGVKPGDWIDAGMGHHCFRCDSECWKPDGAMNLDGEVVCQECLTIADLAYYAPVDAIEQLADRIAINDLDEARIWAAEAEISDDMWAEAIRRAAT